MKPQPSPHRVSTGVHRRRARRGARLALKLRHGGEVLLDDMEDALFDLAEGLAQAQGLTLKRGLVTHVIAATLDEGVMWTIRCWNWWTG